MADENPPTGEKPDDVPPDAADAGGESSDGQKPGRGPSAPPPRSESESESEEDRVLEDPLATTPRRRDVTPGEVALQMADPDTPCALHPERAGLVQCPRCDKSACLECWQHAQSACIACVLAFPTELSPPIPWETEGVGFFAGLRGTLRQAFQPTATAPAFAGEGVRPALGFALLTFLPLAALQGLIPYTQKILFGHVTDAEHLVGARQIVFGPLELVLAPGATGSIIALDVIRAMSLGMALGTVQLMAMGLCFASLTTSFGLEKRARASTAWRAVLYRGFMIMGLPVAMAGGNPINDLPMSLLFFLGFPEEATLALVTFLSIAVGVWMLTTLRVAARLAQGVSAWMSFVIPFLAITVCIMVRLLSEWAVSGWMPDPASIRDEFGLVAPTSEEADDSETPSDSEAAPTAPEVTATPDAEADDAAVRENPATDDGAEAAAPETDESLGDGAPPDAR